MRALFIYWRVAPDQADAALTAAADLQRVLAQRYPGLLAGLYRRADADSSTTLMETYALPPGGISDSLQAALTTAAALALRRWCQGDRHVEAFDSVAAAAG